MKLSLQSYDLDSGWFVPEKAANTVAVTVYVVRRLLRYRKRPSAVAFV